MFFLCYNVDLSPPLLELLLEIITSGWYELQDYFMHFSSRHLAMHDCGAQIRLLMAAHLARLSVIYWIDKHSSEWCLIQKSCLEYGFLNYLHFSTTLLFDMSSILTKWPSSDQCQVATKMSECWLAAKIGWPNQIILYTDKTVVIETWSRQFLLHHFTNWASRKPNLPTTSTTKWRNESSHCQILTLMPGSVHVGHMSNKGEACTKENGCKLWDDEEVDSIKYLQMCLPQPLQTVHGCPSSDEGSEGKPSSLSSFFPANGCFCGLSSWFMLCLMSTFCDWWRERLYCLWMPSTHFSYRLRWRGCTAGPW